MRALAVLLAVVVVAGATLFWGCGPRAGVARDKLVAQIDRLLGDMEVKRKKIELDYNKLRNDLDGVRERRINTQVRLEQLELKQKNAAAKVAALASQLQELAGVAKQANESESKSVERNGKVWTSEQLNTALKELMDEYNRAKADMESNLGTAIAAMKRSLDFLQKQESAGKDMMKQIETKLQEIDARKMAMDAVKSATDLAGNETSITEKYAGLSKDIEGLFTSVETEMRKQEENLKDLQSTTSTADQILGEAPSDLDATLKQIEAILGKPAAGGGGN